MNLNLRGRCHLFIQQLMLCVISCHQTRTIAEYYQCHLHSRNSPFVIIFVTLHITQKNFGAKLKISSVITLLNTQHK